MIHVIKMTKTNPLCWAMMPQFIERVRKFSQEFTVTGVDNSAHWFEGCFGAGDERILGIALVEREEHGEPRLIGHLLAGCEQYLGAPCGMVYQFSKDKGEDFLKTENDGERAPYILMRNILEYWARKMEMNQIYALVDGAARTRLFGWFGFSDNMRIVRMQLNVDTV